MKALSLFRQQLARWLWPRRKRGVDIARTLDARTLDKVHQEAWLLKARYAVDVKSLEPGETPGSPQQADADH